ncbi:uncharacterized protein PAC_06011 [Phialocephala subalpina]|uniref:WW domain-containing protein n=1 Tax=Phialocephala subalpina TaxID=576137 RepID=A0A1L7WTQ3_9HELO|nr:uncharacterized protein PAC_06011 [Phialocephala subalpina]
MAAPPTFPPNLAPPQVPPGWRADWSPQHNTWYYINLTTQASQWNFPVEQAPVPYGAPPPTQQYQPYPQQQQLVPPQTTTPQPQSPADGAQPAAPGEDGERGLGKIAAGGLLGVAGGLIAGAIFNKEKEENKIPKPHFSFWNNSNDSSNESLNNQQSGGGPASWFSKFGSGGGNQPSFMAPVEGAVAGAATGGLFGSMASHMPHIPGHNAAPPPNYHGSPPPPQQHIPQAAPQQYPTPQYQTPSYRGNGPPLHIHCAAWSDQDITHIVRRMVTPNQSIDFDTDDLSKQFGDPWPGAPKQFSIIYSYGPRPWELVATASGRGKFSLLPHEPLSKDRMSYIQAPNSRIVAVVWGRGNALDKDATEKLTEIETTGEFQASIDWAGFDDLWGPGKVAVAYYRTANGEVKFAAAREGGTCRLPWNPLAKWS